MQIAGFHTNGCIQNTNLTRTQLSLSVSLIENGVNPEALAVRTLFFFPLSLSMSFRLSPPFSSSLLLPLGINALTPPRPPDRYQRTPKSR